MSWKGERNRHAMAARGIRTTEDDILVQVINWDANRDLNNRIGLAAKNINPHYAALLDYGISDTASQDSLWDYISRQLEIDVKQLQNKNTDALERKHKQMGTHRDGTYNPFNVFTPDDIYDLEYNNWEELSKNLQKAINKETKLLAKRIIKYQDGKPNTTDNKSRDSVAWALFSRIRGEL